MSMVELKDDQLAKLAEQGNVAQFVSFGPGSDPVRRHSRIAGLPDNMSSTDVDAAIRQVMDASPTTVNVRTFRPGETKGNPFHYGLDRVEAAAALVRSYAVEGFYTIVNETVDVNDGGVSGVCLGGIVEFSPGDTPRAVEGPGVAVLPLQQARALFKTVYRASPAFPESVDQRVEFSIHPRRVGYRRTHTLLWEWEHAPAVELAAGVRWPNRFSRLIGDKAYGLLVASTFGLPVPASLVVPRLIAPFSFGDSTGTGEWWMRTAPMEQQPGRFSTTRGWSDPFKILADEDPSGTELAAVIAQEAVEPVYSGASLPRAEEGYDFVEGVHGPGDDFMLGSQRPDDLPPAVIEDVRSLAAKARKHLGEVRLEWVYDGTQAWIVQLHLSSLRFQTGVISPGSADKWLTFEASEGLPRLRQVVEAARVSSSGVEVIGDVGLTSHIGDLLRKAGVPARFAPFDPS